MSTVSLPAARTTPVRSSATVGWAWWLTRRLGAGLLVVWGVTVFIFVSTQLLPNDPAHAILGIQATQESIDALTRQLGLDRPAYEQYAAWLGGLLHGDFGISLGTKQPVTAVIGYRFFNSVVLMLIAAVIAIPLAVFLGVVTAVRRDRRMDRTVLSAGMVLTSLPDFVIALALVVLFATTVTRLLPAVSAFPAGDWPTWYPNELVLPVATMVLVSVPYLYRLFRASMIDVLESEYVQMARLKGIPERVIIVKHALPNALVPGIQATGLLLSGMLAGIVIVEYVFRYPGLGTALTQAINIRDLPVIQAIVLIYALAVVLFNLLADIATILATPKLRTARS
ncbi:ABC transporter permease [Microbacterium deminutum]|uniref:ABC transporter permease n=1 Tax=Microbacterium deminutum TaxID=344164 RepID=A0ABN2RHP6_9MICO